MTQARPFKDLIQDVEEDMASFLTQCEPKDVGLRDLSGIWRTGLKKNRHNKGMKGRYRHHQQVLASLLAQRSGFFATPPLSSIADRVLSIYGTYQLARFTAELS